MFPGELLVKKFFGRIATFLRNRSEEMKRACSGANFVVKPMLRVGAHNGAYVHGTCTAYITTALAWHMLLAAQASVTVRTCRYVSIV